VAQDFVLQIVLPAKRVDEAA
jgi:hypothetical protein